MYEKSVSVPKHFRDRPIMIRRCPRAHILLIFFFFAEGGFVLHPLARFCAQIVDFYCTARGRLTRANARLYFNKLAVWKNLPTIIYDVQRLHAAFARDVVTGRRWGRTKSPPEILRVWKNSI